MAERDPRAERYVESVERAVPAPSSEVFAVLTDIDRHAALDGSGMLRGHARGPARWYSARASRWGCGRHGCRTDR